MIHVVEPWRLAKEFSRIISKWLTPEELAEANRLNKTPEYTTHGLCATHNYCDGNQAMIDALEVCGIEWDSDNIDLCNAAWGLAKVAGFNPEHVRSEMDGLKRYEAIVQTNDGLAQEARTYVDWFADDDKAITGYPVLMRDIGFRVASVAIGFPCVVTLE